MASAVHNGSTAPDGGGESKVNETSEHDLGKDKDFYKILGIERTATEADIKHVYRKLALKHHPDRNPGSTEAADKFKEVSIAYAVLSDPNKRRQYDLGGPSSAIVDFESVDVTEMGSMGRMFGAVFSKLGVPIPTQISTKCRALAEDITKGEAEALKHVTALKPGYTVSNRVEKQEAHFFHINLTEQDVQKGVIVSCRSFALSKFKVILFDSMGGVRQIEESSKRKNKKYTIAELFFVPFDRMTLNEFFPMKFFMEDKDVPIQLHLLDTLEPSANIRLEPGKHLLAVFGDNWLQDVKYVLNVYVAEPDAPVVPTIIQTETQLKKKKHEMEQFRTEFIDAKKKFEECCERLGKETKEITEALTQREAAYDEFMQISAAKYGNNNAGDPSASQSPGLVRGFMGSIFGGK